MTAFEDLVPDLTRRSAQPDTAQIGCAISTHTGNAVTTHAATRTKIGGSACLISMVGRH